MTEQVKPCPFCGAEPKVHVEDCGPGYQTSLVRCKCGAEMGKIGLNAIE